MAIQSNSVSSTTTKSTTSSGNAASARSGGRGSNNHLNVSEGQVLKGVVTDIRGKEVTIQLSDGSTFTGQISDASNYSIGQNASFQVTSASTKMIFMKAISDALLLDEDSMIFKALDAAALPKTARNAEVVHSLLNTQQSISKQNILSSLRLLSEFPNNSVNSVLTAKYLNLPMTPESIAQFQQYQDNNHQLLYKMDALTDYVGEVFSLISTPPSEITQTKGLDLLNLALEPTPTLETQLAPKASTFLPPTISTGNSPLLPTQILFEGKLLPAALFDSQGVPIIPQKQLDFLLTLDQETLNRVVLSEEGNLLIADPDTGLFTPLNTEEPIPFTKQQLGGVLTPKQLESFYTTVENLASDSAQPDSAVATTPSPTPSSFSFDENVAQSIKAGTATIKETLTFIQQAIPSLPPEELSKLFTQKEFQMLVKAQFMEGWTIAPHAMKDHQDIEQLYAKIDRQMTQLSKLGESLPSQKPFADVATTANDMHQNINFMKTLNDTFSYIQLPINLKEQNAHGELFVMTKKDALRRNPDKLKVLLHLELDNLGTIDIHIQKENLNVDTKFYVEDEKTKKLLEKNLDLLDDAITTQGYLFTGETQVSNQEIDIVKDFIAGDVPIGTMQRYNFDLRA